MPPELDLTAPTHLSLRDYCPQAVLDCFAGWACLIAPDLNIQAVNRGWDEGMTRAHRTDLLSEAIWNKPFLTIFDSQEQQLVFRKLLQAMAERNLTGHSQVVDFTSGSRPFHLHLSVHPLWDEEMFIGYVATAVDATADYLHRIALGDRDKKIRELRKQAGEQREQFKIALNRLGDRHAGETTQVVKFISEFAGAPSAFPENFCKQMMELSGSLYATLYELNQETGRLRLGALYNAPDFYEMARRSNLIEIAIGEAPCGNAVSGGKPVRYDHVRRREDFAPWLHIAEEHGYHCIWAIPVLDGGNIYGAVQLYFADPEQNFPSETIDLLSLLCTTCGPLLSCVSRMDFATRVPEGSNPDAADSENDAPSLNSMPDAYRFVAGGLAEEFSNLLTGVLGHSSLATSEMGESHPATADVRAIEKSARSAARLTRKLIALSGEGRKSNSVELGQLLQRYVEQDRHETFDGNVVQVAVPVVPCHVKADGTALEVILDGLVEHAFSASNSPAMLDFKLETDGEGCTLTLHYDGPVMAPRGWDENEAPQPVRHRHYELFLAREAARALGGDIVVNPEEDGTALVLTLPAASVPDPKPAKSNA